MRLDGKKDIQCIKSAWSILHSELKLAFYREGNNTGHKTNMFILLRLARYKFHVSIVFGSRAMINFEPSQHLTVQSIQICEICSKLTMMIL